MSNDDRAVFSSPAIAAGGEGSPAEDAGLAALQEDPRRLLSLAEVSEPSDSYKDYLNQVSSLDRIFKSILRRARADIRMVDTVAQRLLTAVRDKPGGLISYILGGEVRRYELAKSAVNTAILSAHIALEMKLPSHRIMQTITGALLHDVGMLRLPQDLVKKTGALSPEELRRMQTHTLYSYRIVHEEMNYSTELGTLALQHHEHWDGSGYPQGVAGEDIHPGARIVSVCDAFEAMVSEKPYRNSMLGYQAMKNLLADNSRRFAPDVLKSLITVMGIYPIGSIVLLNNGAMARVANVRRDAPLRPRLAVLVDPEGKVPRQDQGEHLDLLLEKSLYIVRAINPDELTKDAL
ncbi:MAG: HD-GYP domain-containing protein [Treponema sp.]|jgi:HD-GYP domain-containing protein (c-di-GMP phosphodiesterase class II)|nr:HD-GYP domain-containing protein [Treponema sp.]